MNARAQIVFEDWEILRTNAELDGRNARVRGHAINHCPKYDGELYQCWVAGWRTVDDAYRKYGI